MDDLRTAYHLDYLCQQLDIGDRVVLSAPGYNSLSKATVIAFTPKMVKVKFDGQRDRTALRYSTDLVKINSDVSGENQ